MNRQFVADGPDRLWVSDITYVPSWAGFVYLAIALCILYSLPVGIHHLFMDPEHGTGHKFVQMLLTVLVTAPTLLTIFTIAASFWIAGLLRAVGAACLADNGKKSKGFSAFCAGQ